MTGVVALLAGAFAVHCQEAVVSFENYLALSPYIYVSLGTIMLGGSAPNTGVPANDTRDGNDWTVALWGGPPGDSPAQLEANGNLATATLENGVSDSVPGTWFSDELPGIPGTSTQSNFYAHASVQLAAWYNDGGAITSYAAAQAAGVPVGLSPICHCDSDRGLISSRHCATSAERRIRKYNPFIPAGCIPVRAGPDDDSQC